MATNYFTSLPAPEIRNALVNFQPMTNAFEAVRDQNNENRNALMRQQQMDAQKEERTYQRGRDQVADQRQYAKQLGDFGVAVQREQDPTRRQALWNRTLAFHKQYFPGQTLTPEEMDINTGPTLLAAEVGKVFDPRDDRMKDLDLQYKQAQIGKLNREAAGQGEVPSNVREWLYYNRLNPEEQQRYLTMKRSIPFLDQGTQFAQPNLAVPGQVVQTVPKNVAETERQKTIGREGAQGAMALPKTKAALDQYEIQTNVLQEDIGRALKLADGWSTTGLLGAASSYAPGTPGYDLHQTLNTIKANVGFDKLQAMRDASPTGGALGQVSEQENILLQSVLGALSQAQSKEQMVYNLNRLSGVVNQYRELKRKAYEQDVARFGAANVPNPETGQMPSGAPQNGDGWTTLPNGIRIREKQ